MSLPRSNSRDSAADFLKGTACLCMIQVYLVELFITKEFAATGIGKVCMFFGGPPAAPVFLVVPGYFMAASSKSAGQRAWRGVQLLGIGLLLNLGLNAHLLFRIKRGEFQSLDPMHFVFGVDILWLAGLSILLFALLHRLMRRSLHWWEGALFAMVIALATPFVNETMDEASGIARYFAAYPGGTFSWSYYPVFPWMACVCLGMTARGFVTGPGLNSVPAQGRWIALAGCLGATVLGGFKTFAVTSNLPEYYHHDLQFFLWMISFLILWTIGHHQVSIRCADLTPIRFIRWPGRNITAVQVFNG